MQAEQRSYTAMPPDLTEASSRFSAALSAAGDLAYDWDLESDALDWFGALDRLSLAPEAAVTGRLLAGLVNPEDLAQRQHRLNRHFHAGEPFACEYRVRAAAGS